MLDGKKFGALLIGIMILLAFVLAACSAEPPVTSNLSEAGAVGRDIKVYESPT